MSSPGHCLRKPFFPGRIYTFEHSGQSKYYLYRTCAFMIASSALLTILEKICSVHSFICPGGIVPSYQMVWLLVCRISLVPVGALITPNWKELSLSIYVLVGYMRTSMAVCIRPSRIAVLRHNVVDGLKWSFCSAQSGNSFRGGTKFSSIVLNRGKGTLQQRRLQLTEGHCRRGDG